MTRKFPGMMPGKGQFIKWPQVPVIGNTDLELLLSKLNRRKKPVEA